MLYQFDNLTIAFVVGILIFIVGAITGSIASFSADRIDSKKALLTEPFRCDTCNEKIPLKHSIPLISYFVLKRRCCFCKCRIPVSYLIIELLSALLSLFAFLCVGYSWWLIILLLLIPILMAVSLVDLKTGEVPYRYVIGIAVLGLCSVFIPNSFPWYEHLIGMVIISVPFAVFAFFGAMGGGDVLLMAAAGFLLGWNIVPAALIGIVLGAIYGGFSTFVFGQSLLKENSAFIHKTVKAWYFGICQREDRTLNTDKFEVYGECLHGVVQFDLEIMEKQDLITEEDWHKLENDISALISKKSYFHFNFVLDSEDVNDVQCKNALLFVPFLSVGIFTSALFGHFIINWYLNLIH